MSSGTRFVIAIGELLWDMLPEGPQLGGAPANFAYHCAKQGARTALISAVGDDDLGREAIARLKAYGVSTRYIATVPALPTGKVDLVLDADGSPEYDIGRDAAWDRLPWDFDIADAAYAADAVCYGTLAGRSFDNINTIDKVLTLSSRAMHVFDINLRPPFVEQSAIMAGLMRATVVKLNEVEAKYLGAMFGQGECTHKQLFDLLSERFSGIGTLIVTDGADGSYVFDRDEGESFLPSPRVEVADTVGAGDAFTATFVVSRLNGADIAEAHARAAHVAAAVCTLPGAMPDIY